VHLNCQRKSKVIYNTLPIYSPNQNGVYKSLLVVHVSYCRWHIHNSKPKSNCCLILIYTASLNLNHMCNHMRITVGPQVLWALLCLGQQETLNYLPWTKRDLAFKICCNPGVSMTSVSGQWIWDCMVPRIRHHQHNIIIICQPIQLRTWKSINHHDDRYETRIQPCSD